MHNKKILITGGSRGIGAAAVRLFASEGYRVCFIYRSSAEAASALCTETGAYAIAADVSVRKEVDRAISKAIEWLGGLDVLINNAAVSEFKMFNDITETDMFDMMNTNFGGVFRCTQAALGEMLRNKRGSIINVSSVWGITGASCEVHYSASKAAIIGMTKALAKELAPSGIRVNCVAPGIVDTEMNAELDGEDIKSLQEQIPMGRLGSSEDIAKTLLFLASDQASYITGQIISPNGGFLI